MATGKRRLHPINREEVLRLQRAMGLNVWQLAERAGLNWKTINTWLNGEVEGALISKVKKLAKALGVSPDRIIDAPGKARDALAGARESHVFEMTIKLRGTLDDPRQAAALTQAAEVMLNNLNDNDVAVSTHESQVVLFTSKEGNMKRILLLLYGVLEEGGGPFWLFAAVKPEMYQLFKMTQNHRQLDLHNFEMFGEIIVSGEGGSPPDDVAVKVAEMYQTDRDGLLRALKADMPEF